MAGFPPGTTGARHTVGNYTWEYDGTAWVGIGITFGAQGIAGSQGIQGTQGVQGIAGQDGENGTLGTQGIQGIQGVQGIQGTQGSTGPQGTQGTQGSTGPQGTQGTQGVQGIQGTQGFTGPQGTQGTQGVQGTQGTQGSTGPQGTQGIQGVQGIQGTQGSTGPQGTQGIQGVQGSTGSQGVQGGFGIYGRNAGIFSEYRDFGAETGFTCGRENSIFFFRICSDGCGTACLDTMPPQGFSAGNANVMCISKTEALSNADIGPYLQGLADNVPAGYWFIRYHNSDPSEEFLTIFASDAAYSTSVDGFQFVCFNETVSGGIISGGLPTDGVTYALTYYPN